MRDEIGNKITEGRMIYLKQWGVVAEVLEVKDGGLSLSPDPRNVSAAGIVIRMEMPFELSQMPGWQPGKEAQLGGILVVMNPKQEELLNRLAVGRPS